jgi:hypothetical protein
MFVLGSTLSVADDGPNLLDDRFSLAIGSYVVDTDTEVRLDGRSGQGTRFDWEQTFGGGDANRLRLDGQWRFADRHKARFMVFTSSNTSSRRIGQNIDWGDETFPATANVKSEFGFGIYELAYEYAFLRRDKYEIAGSFGLHFTELELELSARASNSNGTLQADISEKGNVGAPLPVLGLRGQWALPWDLWLDVGAQYFALEIDNYDGSLSDLRATITWQPSRWLGIGIGYNRFSFDMDVDADRFSGSLDWTYAGPMLFYSATF